MENPRRLLEESFGWTIGKDPLFEAGSPDEPESQDFYRVRGLVRFSDGVTVVANDGSYNLVYLDSSGNVTRTAGRWGNGPGEFRAISSLGRFRGDSVYVVDLFHRTLSFFDKEGTYARQVRFGSLVPHGYLPQGALSDGRFLFASDAFMIGGGGGLGDSTAVFLLSLEGTAPDTVGWVPKSYAGNPPGSMDLGPLSVFAVGESHFYWGYGDRFEFRQFDHAGRLVRILSKEWKPYHVTDRAWQRAGEARVAALRRSRNRDIENLIRRARQEHATIDHAETLPAFREALVDTEGNLWVREYPLIGVRGAPWHVFDQDGRWITTVEAPERFTLYAVGPDWVAGVALDELDAEVVQVLPLRK